MARNRFGALKNDEEAKAKLTEAVDRVAHLKWMLEKLTQEMDSAQDEVESRQYSVGVCTHWFGEVWAQGSRVQDRCSVCGARRDPLDHFGNPIYKT